MKLRTLPFPALDLRAKRAGNVRRSTTAASQVSFITSLGNDMLPLHETRSIGGRFWDGGIFKQLNKGLGMHIVTGVRNKRGVRPVQVDDGLRLYIFQLHDQVRFGMKVPT